LGSGTWFTGFISDCASSFFCPFMTLFPNAAEKSLSLGMYFPERF